MTEAQKCLYYIAENMRMDKTISKEGYEYFQQAIKALEQEPCDDVISRQAVDAIIKKYRDEQADVMSEICLERAYGANAVGMLISDLPSVTPQPKTVLYSGDGYADGYMVYDMAECPNCGYEYEEDDKDWGLPFCPNCGQSLNWESEG